MPFVRLGRNPYNAARCSSARGVRFGPDWLDLLDDFFVRFTGLYDFRECFRTDAQFLQEPLVSWSRIDVVADRPAERGSRFVGDSRQPRYAAHHQSSASRPKLRGGVQIVHSYTPFVAYRTHDQYSSCQFR